MTIVKTGLILVYIFILIDFLFAQNQVDYIKEAMPIFKTELQPLETPIPIEEKTVKSFLDFINKEAYAATISKDEERRILREEWSQLLGIDVFYLYFKKREIEEWISEKTRIEFLKIKGRAKFQDDQIGYIFKIKF